MSTQVDHKKARSDDTAAVLDSKHLKRVVVAGPGTGKSYLFEEAIKREVKNGNSKFLALTFMGKLCDGLADDLAGLATTKTLHGFARSFVLSSFGKKWDYVPAIKEIISEDLDLMGVKDFEVGDEEYSKQSKLYKAIGHDDVMHYAIELCRKNEEAIPAYDMILVDEYQDLNEKEAEFVDYLGRKNKLLVVGDDDQALYEFKGSFSKYIRQKYGLANEEFESHTLRYCSRCTSVIVDAFHEIVKNSDLTNNEKERIQKEYICYTPDKQQDSNNNPKILVMKDISDGLLVYKISSELETVLEEQKIKSVLILGEGRSCQATLSLTARLLTEKGYINVNHKNRNNSVNEYDETLLQAYRLLANNEDRILGWRLAIGVLDEEQRSKLLKDSLADLSKLPGLIPNDFRNTTIKNSKALKRIQSKPKSNRDLIASSSLSKLADAIIVSQKSGSEIMIDELVGKSKTLPRPQRNLDITVTSILGAKGLGADVVFLVGFDNKRLPKDPERIDKSEIYQFLVALTRTKKRLYLINSKNKETSKFLQLLGEDKYKVVT